MTDDRCDQPARYQHLLYVPDHGRYVLPPFVYCLQHSHEVVNEEPGTELVKILETNDLHKCEFYTIGDKSTDQLAHDVILKLAPLRLIE